LLAPAAGVEREHLHLARGGGVVAAEHVREVVEDERLRPAALLPGELELVLRGEVEVRAPERARGRVLERAVALGGRPVLRDAGERGERLREPAEALLLRELRHLLARPEAAAD